MNVGEDIVVGANVFNACVWAALGVALPSTTVCAQWIAVAQTLGTFASFTLYVPLRNIRLIGSGLCVGAAWCAAIAFMLLGPLEHPGAGVYSQLAIQLCLSAAVGLVAAFRGSISQYVGKWSHGPPVYTTDTSTLTMLASVVVAPPAPTVHPRRHVPDYVRVRPLHQRASPPSSSSTMTTTATTPSPTPTSVQTMAASDRTAGPDVQCRQADDIPPRPDGYTPVTASAGGLAFGWAVVTLCVVIDGGFHVRPELTTALIGAAVITYVMFLIASFPRTAAFLVPLSLIANVDGKAAKTDDRIEPTPTDPITDDDDDDDDTESGSDTSDDDSDDDDNGSGSATSSRVRRRPAEAGRYDAGTVKISRGLFMTALGIVAVALAWAALGLPLLGSIWSSVGCLGVGTRSCIWPSARVLFSTITMVSSLFSFIKAVYVGDVIQSQSQHHSTH